MEQSGKTYLDDWDAVFEDHAPTALVESLVPAPAPPSQAPAPAPDQESPLKRNIPTAIASSVGHSFAQPGPIFPRCSNPDHYPALFARSGLFAAQRVARRHPASADAREVLGQGGYRATIQGPHLSMTDKLAFEAITRLAKAARLDLDQPLRTSLREIAREMGWSDTGGGTLRFVKAALERFAETRLSFTLEDKQCRAGMLLLGADMLPDNAGVELRFDPGFVIGAFSADKQYRIDRARRSTLASSPLAMWLHDFVSTHSKSAPLDLLYLRERCGFQGLAKDFPRRLRRAADDLRAVAPGLLASYAIKKGRRSSEKWTVEFVRGAEKASFLLPESANTRRPAL